MALPHIASVMNTKESRQTWHAKAHCLIHLLYPDGYHFLIGRRSNTFFCREKYNYQNKKPTAANKDMVQSQPCALSLPSENLLTNGKVSPCTTNCAIVEK